MRIASNRIYTIQCLKNTDGHNTVGIPAAYVPVPHFSLNGLLFNKVLCLLRRRSYLLVYQIPGDKAM